MKLGLDIQVFPNPTVDQITIRIGTHFTEGGTIELYDLKGNRLISQALNKSASPAAFRLDLSDLASGMYLIKTKIGSDLKTNRIVKR